MKKLGIYVHVPFCRKKCSYCDFYSVRWDDELEHKYVESVKEEIEEYKKVLDGSYKVDTLYFGGGTPTIIKPSNIKKIADSVEKFSKIEEDAEISMEANPNTLTDDNLKEYKKAGINRLSIGIQSLNDDILKKIGRLHNSREALDAIDRAINCGFENINADVMFNIPGQTVEDIEDTLKRIMDKGVKHISFYSLKLEKGTPLYLMEQKKLITMPEEDTEREMYYRGREIMEEGGLMQYEISNFAANGKQCLHNLKYWNQDEYLGLGPSAHSFLDRTRYSNPSDLKLYCMGTKAFERTIQEKMDMEDLMFEYIMLMLRLTEGLDTEKFKGRYNIDFFEKYKRQLEILTANKLIEISENMVRLTHRGMDISNYVFEEFME